MSCEECKELFVGFIEGFLDESERNQVSEHLSGCSSCKSELAKFEKMHERLVSNGKTFSKSNFEENVFNRIVREQKVRLKQAGNTSSILKLWRTLMKSPITKLAAAAGIIIGTFLVFSVNQKTLYAKAIKAFEQVRSIRAVGYKFKNGQIADSMELWYQEGTGTRINETRQGKISIIIDNGKNQWDYTQGNDFAVQRNIYSKIDIPREITEIEYLKECKREPEGDIDIDGDLCKLYIRKDAEKTPTVISKMWLDEQNRFRKYEEQRLIDEMWQTVKKSDIFYDEIIEPNIFTADFGPDIKIITPDQVMDNMLSLENTIAKKEINGLIFAVHELKKCDKYIFVNCSVRPTEETLQQIKNFNFNKSISNEDEYGTFQLTSFWQRKENGELVVRPYGITELSRFTQNGIYSAWYALLPKGQWEGVDEKYELCAFVYAQGRLQEMQTEQGLKISTGFRPLLTLNLPTDNTSVEKIAGDIYEIFKPLSSIYNGKHPFEPNPLTLTKNDFVKQVYTKLDGLKPLSEFWKEVGQNIEIRLIDLNSKPVAGAKVGGRDIRSYDGNLKWYTEQGQIDCLISNDNGEVVIKGEQMFSPNTSRHMATLIYAVKEQEQLAATREITSDDFGKHITIKMQPACRVTSKFTCPELENTNDTVKSVRFLLTSDEVGNKNYVYEVLHYTTEQMTFDSLLIPGIYGIESPQVSTSNGKIFNANGKFITVPKNQKTYDLGTFILKTN